MCVKGNMKPTYRKLAEAIAKMTDEQKDMNATIYLTESDEFLSVDAITQTDEFTNDVLDTGHPILTINY